MIRSLSRYAAILTLLVCSAAVSTSDTGKEPATLDAPELTSSSELNLTLLEYDPVASVCSAETELTLRPAQSDQTPFSQFQCSPVAGRGIQMSLWPGEYCETKWYGVKCFYSDGYCVWCWSTRQWYCYAYEDFAYF